MIATVGGNLDLNDAAFGAVSPKLLEVVRKLM